jgi:hypothetical protein
LRKENDLFYAKKFSDALHILLSAITLVIADFCAGTESLKATAFIILSATRNLFFWSLSMEVRFVKEGSRGSLRYF